MTTAAHLRPTRTVLSGIRDVLPRGGLLPDDAWEARHRWVLGLLFAHSAAILAFALVRGFWPPHAVLEAAIPALAAAVATREPLGRRLRAIAGSFGLLSCSAILVHLSGGYIEMHFHFFVMMIVISLYQDWSSFLLAFAYVVVHHGAIGAIDPASVYNHADAVANPWKWAVIHGTFIAAACLASLANWRLTEDTMLARLASERSARLAAEAGVKLREDFLSVATHELRTPVASVKGYTQLALRGLRSDTDGADRLSPTLESLDRQADRLSRLVTQLLDVSRIQAGRLEIELVRTDIGLLTLNVVETMRQHSGAAHEWVVDVPTGIEATVDGARFEQVVTNLVENAIRYSPEGSPISVLMRHDGGAVTLEVRDRGVGIPPERLPHIFDRFYQAHRDRNLGGMGLGLYVAREIVARHGGDISARSTLGQGTTFTVRIPTEVTELATRPPREAALTPTPARAAVAAGVRVMVVEDDRHIREVVVTLLREEGYEVVGARSGADALRMLGEMAPDLILLDKQMPEMDGTAFADAYRDRPGPHAPIVALCAARDALEWSTHIGAVGYVAKPFELDDLLAAVARHVRPATGTAPGTAPVLS